MNRVSWRIEMSRFALPRTCLFALGASLAASPACLSRPIDDLEPRITGTVFEVLTQSRVDKIDLLLAIDDSGSMGDKQAILARAVPDLVSALVSPPCRDKTGAPLPTPGDPLAPCAEGRREFDPVLDVHIGVISTSLGARGGSVTCADDHARLVTRAEGGGAVPTYAEEGFLAWDPAQKLEPKGEGDAAALGAGIADLVAGAGQEGCGYEAQLESWYRFLVDPEPYESVEAVKNDAGANVRTEVRGVDALLLEQRRAFLRPDSLVAIVMLTDENDCSFRAEGQGFFTAQKESLYSLKARSECAVDVKDACCAPCGYAPDTCPEDPSCDEPAPPDHSLVDLNCFDQKRRYGYDFLYPLKRYVDGLTAYEIPTRGGELVPNPLLVGEDGVRTHDRVFLAGIVGVPWQAIARRDEAGAPDLARGLMTAEELEASGAWGVILGDPARGVPASDPHMVESIAPREGASSVTGAPMAPPSSPSAAADPVNGHEYRADLDANGDLQYACIFDLPKEDWQECESSAEVMSPLCQDPQTGSYTTTQYRAKAYPGLRELGVLQGIGDQAIVASIGPAELADEAAPDYGYRPAVGAIVERLKQELADPCLPRSFTTDDDGQVSCVVIEGRRLDAGESCGCAEAAHAPVAREHRAAREQAAETPSAQAAGLDCYCEIEQLRGEALAACRDTIDEPVRTASGEAVDGFCYVDATARPPLGDPSLVSHCPATERRTIRLVGEAEPKGSAMLFVTCQQSSE
jgi:hypothetical protein